MGNIEEIKESLSKYKSNPNVYDWINGEEYTDDVEYLLSRIQIAEEALKNIVETVKKRELERIFVPNIRYSIEITKIADAALEQIGE
jgi:hypothetical protein